MPNRRLSDSIVTAHKIACEEDKKQIAALMFEALELELTSIGGERSERREDIDVIESAFDRHEKKFGPISPNDTFS